ncbi:hypothetical protein [Chryseobacterium indologenes]|uniref:hypothetical protein n=1 Tax=Chryseobacterium indologenes TaxID=253 RepID=UPI000A5D1431|nr:hypothetical protein [Chryseobacterium indologenes]
MKINLAVPAFIFMVSLTSCISDEESLRQVNSGFKGEYAGTFSGDENGRIYFTVAKKEP